MINRVVAVLVAAERPARPIITWPCLGVRKESAGIREGRVILCPEIPFDEIRGQRIAETKEKGAEHVQSYRRWVAHGRNDGPCRGKTGRVDRLDRRNSGEGRLVLLSADPRRDGLRPSWAGPAADSACRGLFADVRLSQVRPGDS